MPARSFPRSLALTAGVKALTPPTAPECRIGREWQALSAFRGSSSCLAWRTPHHGVATTCFTPTNQRDPPSVGGVGRAGARLSFPCPQFAPESLLDLPLTVRGQLRPIRNTCPFLTGLGGYMPRSRANEGLKASVGVPGRGRVSSHGAATPRGEQRGVVCLHSGDSTL